MSDEENEKNKRDERIVDMICPKCGHKKAWASRGFTNPQYKYKCSKCGFTQ